MFVATAVSLSLSGIRAHRPGAVRALQHAHSLKHLRFAYVPAPTLGTHCTIHIYNPVCALPSSFDMAALS
ncbi:hypothetical protein CBOM_07456 [Ceraceosorus bombacis]|uniref:Uncharacterized protein n=1 Tax=Ceraceosorus bombacis TaxID=401625 RepID=A0A0P1BC00_9BASI|nr:hypothetical protein CBOM_07456 [Ceraceosorus bombacis]